MTETTIYKCEYCGAEFDDEHEANCHEWVCRYNDTRKRDDSSLRFYKDDGTKIKFDDDAFVWTDFDDNTAFIVGNDSDVKFVIDLLGWIGYDAPFSTITDEAHSSNYGLWYFDTDLNYHGEWVRVDDQIKKWTDIKNKFTKDA